MGVYLVRRFALMLLTLFGISVIIFVMLRVAPGNIADVLFDAAGFVDPAAKRQIERDLGLDQPLIVQYRPGSTACSAAISASPMSPTARRWRKSCRASLSPRTWPVCRCYSRCCSAAARRVSAVRQNTGWTMCLRIVGLSGLSIPSFWLGLMVLMVFVAWFHSIPIYSNAPQGFWPALEMYAVPAAVVGLTSAALIMRLTRSSMLEVLRQDYIRTARAKGASEPVVNFHHALKNAILPVVTVVGLQAAFLMGGLVVVETVFNIPGVARFLVDAVRWRDYPIVQNLIMYIAVVVVTVNFLVDMLYAVLDPRIKYGD